RPVLEVVDDDRLPRLVILGDPGAGKSSLLRFLALRWARITDPNEFYTKPLPLLIQLREYDRWECPLNKSGSSGKSVLFPSDSTTVGYVEDFLRHDSGVRWFLVRSSYQSVL